MMERGRRMHEQHRRHGTALHQVTVTCGQCGRRIRDGAELLPGLPDDQEQTPPTVAVACVSRCGYSRDVGYWRYAETVAAARLDGRDLVLGVDL